MTKLRASVGALGVNLAADVLAVQKLINLSIGWLVPRAPLPEDGSCDEKMISAITDYQTRVMRSPRPDGRVDPGGGTLGALEITASGKPFVPKPQGHKPGTKYTDNPNEVPTETTTPSAGDVVAMLLKSWTDLTADGARTLAAQFMAETGGGRFCFNWNLGNVKAKSTDPHMYLHNVWECDSETGAKSQVENSGGLAHVASVDEIRQHGWNCPKSTVVFQPPHAQCRFRAYSSLADGAVRWLTHHQAIAAKNPDFLKALNAGDTSAVAHALKLAGYYTASEASYASGMAAQKKKIDQALGPVK